MAGLASCLLRQTRTAAVPLERRRAGGGASARVEALPPRVMLSVDPAMAQRLFDAGFERITWKGHDSYVEPGRWVASFRNLHGSRDQQLAAAETKLKKAAPRAGLHAARHLGRDGLFRI